MRKNIVQITLKAIAAALSLQIFAATCADTAPIVCAPFQAYGALENIKEFNKDKFSTFYGTADEIYERMLQNGKSCSVVISHEEKLMALLMQAGRIAPNTALPFIKAPLILWSADEKLFASGTKVITQKKLKSLAIPEPKLSYVGYAASFITRMKNFPTEYLKRKITRPEHEYKAFALARAGKAQAAFLTKPLIMHNGKPAGSYWMIDRSYYPAIRYFIATPFDRNNVEGIKLSNYLRDDPHSIATFELHGFEALDR